MYGGKIINDMNKTNIRLTRAHLYDVGLGFYGMDSDIILNGVLTGKKYSKDGREYDFSKLNDRIDYLRSNGKWREKRNGIEQKMKKKRNGIGTLGGAPPDTAGKYWPVFAISNYSYFQNKCMYDEVKPYYWGLRDKIYTYINNFEYVQGPRTPPRTIINAMHVITAPLYYGRSDETRITSLNCLPKSFSIQMREILGEEVCIINSYHVHLCDINLECNPNSAFTDMQSFIDSVKLPDPYYDDNKMDSFFEIFDVNQELITDQLIQFMNKNQINFIYFVGGETHWLNRQLTKCNFKQVLESHGQTHNFVLSGNSAGIINIGQSSYVTACKNYKLMKDADDISVLCNAKGEIIMTPACLPKQQCAPIICGIEEIKYDTLGVKPLTYFPHYKDNQFLDDLISSGCSQTGVDIKNRCMRLTNYMMAYTNEDDMTSYIFADPNIHDFVNNEHFDTIRNGLPDDVDVIEILDYWYEHIADDPDLDIDDIHAEMLAYLYSCASIPKSKQTTLLLEEESYYGGAKTKSNIYGTIFGLAIVSTLAFVNPRYSGSHLK
jgi:hypothetical protein